MKTNLLPEKSVTPEGASHGHATPDSLREPDSSPAARRWELCPEMFQGQIVGWKVVPLI